MKNLVKVLMTIAALGAACQSFATDHMSLKTMAQIDESVVPGSICSNTELGPILESMNLNSKTACLKAVKPLTTNCVNSLMKSGQLNSSTSPKQSGYLVGKCVVLKLVKKNGTSFKGQINEDEGLIAIQYCKDPKIKTMLNNLGVNTSSAQSCQTAVKTAAKRCATKLEASGKISAKTPAKKNGEELGLCILSEVGKKS